MIFLLVLNALLAVVIIYWGFAKEKQKRKSFFLVAWFILICPLVGPAFLFSGLTITYLLGFQELDITSISFSKKREKVVLPPDSERELNYAPLGDAISVADSKETRNLLLDVLKNSDLSAYKSLALAVDDSDTEVSHYATTAVVDILSEFRIKSREMLLNINLQPENADYNISVLEYFDQMLNLEVMNGTEKRTVVHTMHGIGENLFNYNTWNMTAEHYLWMVIHSLSVTENEMAELWLNRAKKYKPDELSTFKARLRFHYTHKNFTEFLACLDELRHTDLVVDQEILELFATFS